MANNTKILNIISFALLCVSICFNFKKWIYDYTFLGYKIYSKVIDIKPTLLTSMYSVFLFGGYIIRNIHDIFKDYKKIIFYVFDLFFFSGFIAMFANGKTNILGFSSQSILLLLIVVMWIGMRSIIRYILLLFIASSFLFISKVNEAMGIFGSIYIFCAFFSFVIQLYTNILPNVRNINMEFCGKKKYVYYNQY